MKKCVKCGSYSSTTIALHRFPKPGKTNSLRCELWAKYCCPDEEWSSLKFQERLYNQHRMLCTKHFKRSSFVDEFGKRLFRFASPDPECDKFLNVTAVNEPSTSGLNTMTHSRPLAENMSTLNLLYLFTFTPDTVRDGLFS